MTMIFHIIPADYFRAQPDSAPYLPAALGADGFIHCTQEPEVLLHIANNYYKNVLFPHIYGPLNRDAIVEIRTAKRAGDGTFISV